MVYCNMAMEDAGILNTAIKISANQVIKSL